MRQFKFTGNSVFSDAELAKVTAPFEGRVITAEELEEVRYRLTVYYVNRGYINSGAVIPDQEVVDGIITMRIVEGRLTDIEVSGNKSLRTEYLGGRIAPKTGTVLNLTELQERLQLLQQNDLIDRINAELAPGIKPGQSVLNVDIEEASPYDFAFVFANDRPPSVGAERAEFYAAHRNLTGWGDAFGLRYGLTDGADDVAGFYTRPLNARDTTLSLSAARSSSTVVEQPFSDLDIDSELDTYEISVTHPLYQTPLQSLTLSVALDRRHSETFLLGRPFSFSPGVQDGESDATVLRLSQGWIDRNLNQVLAARSTFSLGVDAFGATVNGGALPDGQFLAWLGQFQWARRFSESGNQLIVRTDLQLAEDPLLPLEQFAVGGAATVRGYRENQLVRDNGFVASAELRIPVFRLPIPRLSRTAEDGSVQLAPFADFGWAENTDIATPDPKTISSVGLGLRWDPSDDLHAELYWGYGLRDIDSLDDDLQDSGIHFRVQAF
ncbi:MAG: ShlB/FhaC/HecB family hemolysin secretion/activation protein [Gammaproteobacteria bacterium]